MLKRGDEAVNFRGLTLLALAENFVHSLGQVGAETIVFFSGNPPLPLAYRATPEHQVRLSEFLARRYSEPIVQRCLELGVAQWERPKRSDDSRALVFDRWAHAIPISSNSCVYLGCSRRPAEGYDLGGLQSVVREYQPHFERLLRTQAQARANQVARATLSEVSGEATTLLKVVRSTESLASSQDIGGLLLTLRDLLRKYVAHAGGSLSIASETVTWGVPLDLPDKPPRASQGSIFWGEGRFVQLPLKNQEKTHGSLTLDAGEQEIFRAEQVQYLELLTGQAALVASQVLLFQEVVEANKQLEESRAELLQSTKMQAVGRLGAGVAHELNTPLAALSLKIELVEKALEARPEKARECIRSCESSLEKMKRIIACLLHFSTRGDGAMSRLDLRETVRDTLELFRHEVEKNGIEVSLCASEMPAIKGCQPDLQQAIACIVLNAVEALETRQGKKRILMIDVREIEDLIQLRVRDNGCGMSEEVRLRCLDPFFTTKPIGKGPGLGLWVTYQIVEQHGGALQVVSQPDEGTEICISLPGFREGNDA